MRRFTCSLMLVLLSGCAGWEPYVDVAIGVPIDSQTDYWLQTERDWQCSTGPQAHLAVGLESPEYLYVEFNHQSWWLCGGPLNEKPEVDSNQILFGGRWGGQE
jgi:hypothetical protein